MRRRTLIITGLVLSAVLVVVEATPIVPLLRYASAPAAAVVPVAGLRLAAIDDTWGARRSGGRRHEGADLFAPRHTPVVAVTDGEVLRVGANPLGGNTIWLVGGGATLFYYAHLERPADGLHGGQGVRRGEVLGYVGTSGNALHTSPHLHFGAYPLRNRFRPINPVPLLQDWRATTVPAR